MIDLIKKMVKNSILFLIKKIFILFLNTNNWKVKQFEFQTEGKIFKDTEIRISFAYLFRIKVRGKYFLVKNNRGIGKFQPVGGVYKVFKEEMQYLQEKFHIESDNKMPVDEDSTNDYRLMVKNKYLRKFVSRFDKIGRSDGRRETIHDLRREFIEEIFDSGILDNMDDFGCLEYKYCGRDIKIDFSKHFQCYELIIADIVEVNLTKDQKKMFEKIMKEESEKYYFASKDEIESLGVDTNNKNLEENISNHTYKILSNYGEKLTKLKGFKNKVCCINLR